MTPERRRGILQAVGLGLVGLIVFTVSFVIAFPYERIKQYVIALAAAQSLDVEVEHAGPVIGMGVAFDGVRVRTRPPPGQKAAVLDIDKVRVHVSPLAQLRKELALDMTLDTLEGQITADVRAEKERGITKISAQQLAMAQLPGVRESFNLPLAGTFDFDVDILAPGHRNAEAGGTVGWKWAGMTIGDGKAKLKIPGNPLLAEGITLPKVRLGDFTGKVVFTKGVGKLQGVGARSPDAEVKIEGEVRLADPLVYTYLDLYVTFKFSEALLKSDDKIGLMLQFAESMGKRPDGFYGFRLSGTPSRLAPPQWQKTSPFGSGTGGRASAPAFDQAPDHAPPPPTYAAASPRSDEYAPPPSRPSEPARPAERLAKPTRFSDDGVSLRPGANVPKYLMTPPRDDGVPQ